MLDNLSRRERVLAALLAGVLLAVFAYEVLWRTQLVQYRQAQENLRQAQVRLEQVQRAAATLAEARRAREEATLRAARAELSFSGDVAGGTPLLEVGSRLQDLQLLEVSPRPVEEQESFLVLPLDFKLRGSYLQVLEFIRSLESLPHAAEVRSLNLAGAPDSPGLVTADLRVAFYGKKEAPPASVGGQWQLGRLNIFSPALQDLVDRASRPAARAPARQPAGPSAGGAAPGLPPSRPDPYSFPQR